ncbi:MULTISPECIES: hypothetical protein [Nocardiopsidaceae]|uniref:Uncharacterized protein n=1 Tax=Streptomonospora nanhaiensis TaxID=1323731 RepID=A0ABY6YX10_9ACTN|nr:hypothetical protein [Streptomonospora nanhaiensis]WAE76840.1 hypothetical protein OUQ99_31520 [Streptomonospora nanhaiensis]
MSAAKKKASSVPDMVGLTDDWGKMTAMRQGEHGQEEKEAPAPVAKAAPPARPEPKAPAATEMTRRSWYASAEAAEELARVVDDIHHATRTPKHEVVSALFRAAVAAAPRVEKQLSKKT